MTRWKILVLVTMGWLAGGCLFGRTLALAPHAQSLERLTTTDDVDDESPVLSPDGSTLAFASSFYSASAIAVVDPNAPSPAPDHYGIEQGHFDDPCWAPNGEDLVAAYDAGGVWMLRKVGATELSGIPVPIVDSGTGVIGRPSYSPDGRFLAYWRATGPGESWASAHVLVLDATTPGAARDLGAGRNPTWSPDGTRLAFDRVDPDRVEPFPDCIANCSNAAHLYVVDAAGSAPPTKLTQGERDDIWPAWSPDGAWLAFTSNREGPDAAGYAFIGNLFVVSADGSTTLQLTTGDADATQAYWGRDGWIYFSATDGSSYDIYRLRFVAP